jgi:Uma2 family endonuclease
MLVKEPRAVLRRKYQQAAERYLRALPLEHFMESTPHATQRKITLESLDLVTAQRPDVHVFNELLVQYPLPGGKTGQVVPDNMVVIHAGEIEAKGSYDVPLEGARPFWMLEYVSASSKRKDYKDNLRRYARELKTPYYLLFDPEDGTLALYRQARGRYVPVKPNAAGRFEVPELEIEVALLDGWVRFWHQGKLLPLPAELLGELDKTKAKLANANRRIEELERELARAKARKNGKT